MPVFDPIDLSTLPDELELPMVAGSPPLVPMVAFAPVIGKPRSLAAVDAGRQEGLMAWLVRPEPDADELLTALRELPLLVHLPGEGEIPDHWLVHAGLRPSWSDLPAVAARINAGPHDQAWLEAADTKFATRVRCIDADGEMVRFPGRPEERPEASEPWDARRHDAGDGNWVVHGHWAMRGHYINHDTRVIGLDSGCVYGGPLTAYCAETAQVVQVPASSK